MMSWRQKIAFACATALGASILGVGCLLAIDVYLHSRVQNVGGVNIWGYRGPTIGRKRADENRVVVLGGSTAFGYGVPYNEAFPYYLEQMLNARNGGRYRVVNLGAPSQGAHGFSFDLADYRYLEYDVAILYEGYNDLSLKDRPGGASMADGRNEFLWRRQSPVFRLTGYFPVLPLVLREKAMQMRAGGDLNAAYGGRASFQPGLATRATAGALERAAAIADRLGLQVGSFAGDPHRVGGAADHDDFVTWRDYTDRVCDAVRFVRAHGVAAIVVTQPYISDSHIQQQRALASAVAIAFGTDPGVRYVNLGATINLRDRTIAYDGLHLVARGNEVIARQLVDPVLALIPHPVSH
jgi:lysophospholipase L1-like esterase